MSIVPTSQTWPTVFVKAPIPQQEAPPITGRCDFGLAYELANALSDNPRPEVLTDFLGEYSLS